ncbi:hypothetical protein [Verrucosispora sp. WMMC514]|uniref:hypothetical protein n=1 Tax=Verrucosispora sp. WMMC514 TaxID=3015156 RepID=UPI00248C4E4A|nr:hypothetical protein [Verrucosispora sp. WMMC514]WBB94137.1 hypothetical protein O7597_14910 [Verrucosispora sp. WMMC514]
MTATTLTPAAQIAAAVRTDIKTASKAGTLALPDGAKIRVTSHNFAGGSAVDIAVENVDKAWAISIEKDEWDNDKWRPTAAAQALGDQLTDILAAHHNGRAWGEVRVCGLAVDRGRIKPASWRPGQD